MRALAILPVLLFHAGVPGFSGGYVGVDIFFVISGFLITGILAREIDAGDFSILRFYERRARRIMPALLVMIAAVLIAAAWLYLPDDFEEVPRAAIAATLFVSNISLFLDIGYFSGGAETKPLLHSWSLAVEEQFYIGFPILLILLARHAPAWRTVVVGGIALISLAIAVATQNAGDGFAFYLLPGRAWELFVGALLALGAIPAIDHRRARELICLAGIAAIAWAVFSFDKNTVFPGVNAMPPVLGAAALVHCAPGTRIGRLLGLAPLTMIGAISYSLYLWHWPLIVFVSYGATGPLTGLQSLAIVLGSILIAILSWRFIEQPFRRARPGGRTRLFVGTGAAMASVCAVAMAMVAVGGWPSRFAPDVVRLAGAKNDVSPMRDACHDSEKPCVLGAGVSPTALLWGDSHGVELAYELSQVARGQGRSLVQRTRSSCPPVIGYDPPNLPRCKAENDATLAAIRDDPDLRTIYLAAFWASDAYHVPGFSAELDRTIEALAGLGRTVVLFGPVPPNRFEVPRHLALLAMAGELAQAHGGDRREVDRASGWLDAGLAKWRARGVIVVDPRDTLCRARSCDIIRDGRPLYFDAHHLSLSGARLLVAAAGPVPPSANRPLTATR